MDAKVAGTTDQQVYVFVTTCAHYVQKHTPPDAHCVGRPIRIGAYGTDTIPAGTKIAIEQVGGPAVTITAPKTVIGSSGDTGTLVIPPAAAPWALTTPMSVVTLTVPEDQAVTRQAILQYVLRSLVSS